MTEIPTLEKIEGSKCNTCSRDCEQMCGMCGETFCTRHLLLHSKGCNDYRDLLQAILRDELSKTMTHVRQIVLRAI